MGLPTTPLLWPTLPLPTMPRSTLTRSPPTHTTTPWLTTTPPPTSMLPSPVTELAMLRVLTVSTSLTAASSMLATPPTPSTDTSLQSLMTELLSIPILQLSTLLPLSTLLLSFTLLQLFTLLPLSTTPVLQARALTNLSPSLTRERRGALARPRHSDPRSPLYPRLIPSVTQLRLVWPLISVRELLVRCSHPTMSIEIDKQDRN